MATRPSSPDGWKPIYFRLSASRKSAGSRWRTFAKPCAISKREEPCKRHIACEPIAAKSFAFPLQRDISKPIGRAECREAGGKNVMYSVVAESLIKKEYTK